MILDRENYERWIRDTIELRGPELVQPVRDALEAFETIQATGRIDLELLAPIVDAARSHRRPLYELAVDFLQQLTADYVEAREAVAEMATDKRSQVRFNAVISTGTRTPREFSVNLVRNALRDKSANVRRKAADWAQRMKLTELMSDLEGQLAVENHEGARKTEEFSLRLLRDGYIVEAAADEGYYVTAPAKRGICSRYIPPREFAEKGLAAIVEEINQHE